MTFDVIVIGVGGMGSAAVYHLAHRGLKVLGLERYGIPNEMGSSHGASRIIRLAYAEHPDYVPLLRRAYALWRELEQGAGEQLLVITGGIDAGEENSATLTGSLQSCAIHDLPHECLDAAEVARRFPGYRLPSTMLGVYQPDAGFLLPERCIAAHAAAARACGAELHERERVLHWDAKDDSVVVTTDRATYRASRVIVSAGAWARTLIPALSELAVPERQVMMWTQPLRPDYFEPAVFPVFNMEAAEGRFYGFPVHGRPGFKIGKYHHRLERIDDLERMNRDCGADDEAVLREGVRRYFPDANGATLAMQACLFTNSPDEHFIIDRLAECPRVTVAAGFSGHGFKFCSVVGDILAELTIDGSARLDIGMFRLARLMPNGAITRPP